MHNLNRTMKNYTLTILFLFSTLIVFAQDKNYEKGLKSFDSKNYLKSFELLKPFADNGDSMAEFVVGFCYFNPELKIKNDSLAEHYLLSSAEKLNTKAMGFLSIFYFQKGLENEKFKVQSLVWAEIAGSYDPIFNETTTRFLIRNYLNENELKQVEEILLNKKSKFEKINIEAFHSINKQLKNDNENSEKARIPENKLNLIENPYSDWVYRWKREHFECDTMFYTAEIESQIIDSTIINIKNNKSFKIDYLYNGNQSKPFKITPDEQNYLITELEKLKNYRWEKDIFPFSKRLEQNEIQETFDQTEKLATEKEKNMCSIVYTFSKPIFIRNNTIALYLNQSRYRTNYTQLDFSFYKLENERWEKIVRVYSHYESAKE